MLSYLRQKHLGTWLPGYVRHLAHRSALGSTTGRHLIFALCDHFEPLWGNASSAVGDARVEAWETAYPPMASAFRDADGRSPRHSFFFPGEQYEPRVLERLAKLARAGFGEVELHLHHDGDSAATLTQKLADYVAAYAGHGHGNWCLANARNDPPTYERVRSWVAQGIHVRGRPEWVFVKVHTHGAPEEQAASLLGEGGRSLHRALTSHFNDGEKWTLHYMTARETYNVARAAMDGRSGNPFAYRDYVLSPPPVAQA